MQNKQQKISVEKILKSSATWNGVALSDHFSQDHEVTMVKISIGPGERLPMHSHPVMSVSYILSGELTVISDMSEQKVFHTGQAFLGLINQNHYGMNNTESEVEVLAVYLGKQGQIITEFVGDQS